MLRILLVVSMIRTGVTSFAQSEDMGAIYSIGIQSRLHELGKKKVFIMDSVTDAEFSLSTRRLTKMYRKFYNPDSIDNTYPGYLDSINCSLKEVFNGYNNTRLISMKENNMIFDRGVGDGWPLFYKLYPAYAGIVFLSQVYFNRQHTRAMYQFSLARQPCANSRNTLVFLGKDKNGNWYRLGLGK